VINNAIQKIEEIEKTKEMKAIINGNEQQ